MPQKWQNVISVSLKLLTRHILNPCIILYYYSILNLQFSRKDVIKQYCKYVNNFSLAMKTLESNIKKKQRFLEFLKKQLIQSGTQLSLQALLLKPVQRFPQYLLFIQVGQ